MASASREGGFKWPIRTSPSPASSPVIPTPTQARSRRSSRTSSLLKPRSRSSSSTSSNSSQPISPHAWTTSSHGSQSSLFIPSFTSTYHSQGDGTAQIQREPSINEGEVMTGNSSIRNLPGAFNPTPMYELHTEIEQNEDSSDEQDPSTSTLSLLQPYPEDGDELGGHTSAVSSTDSLSTLATVPSTAVAGRTDLPAELPPDMPTDPTPPTPPPTSTSHSVLLRAVPSLASTKFTALAQQYQSRQDLDSAVPEPDSVAAAPPAHKLGGFSAFRHNTTGSHRNSSTVSLILEDTSSSVSSTKSHANKLRKKVSNTSLVSLTGKSKNSSTALSTMASTAAVFGARARNQSTKSRFAFLQSKSQTPPPPPTPVLTGGPRQHSSHHYRVLPSDTTGSGRVSPASSDSGSSTTSLSSSQSTLGQNTSADASQQTLFTSTSKNDGGKLRKSSAPAMESRPVLTLDVRRMSVGSQPSPPTPYASTATLTERQHKHHLLLRPRKDSHQGMKLSSSSSNSKLTSDAGSLYSFNPSSPANAPYAPYGLQKSISTIDVKNLTYKDMNKIPEQALEDVWPFLCARVTPLFTGDGLRVPVEDLNKLVMLHTKRKIAERDPAGLITDVKDLLRLGISAFDMTSRLQSSVDSEIVERVSELWTFYYASVLPYVRAVFVPLQLEFDGAGSLMTPEQAIKFWERQKVQPVKMNNIRNMVLASFRDWVVLPLYLRLKSALKDGSSFLPKEVYPQLLQCMGILTMIHSGDEKQNKSEELAKLVRELWIKARSGGQ
ncbi:HbrB-like-domain-containing protein [Lipomyces arxii]|uniref:HbrB-like-domain-containing protein n=1 Tax=Lipomyces arxii TaxID=56418 RepID=UPI0034CF60CE